MTDFLFELGLEEVPARMLASGEAELAQRVRGLLERERLLDEGAEVQSFSSPRRLAVLVRGVLARQVDAEEEMVGPPVKAAFKDGVATAAAHAFAKKAGVAVESLKTVTTPKGEYLAASVTHAGRGAAEVIAAELPKERLREFTGPSRCTGGPASRSGLCARCSGCWRCWTTRLCRWSGRVLSPVR